MTKEGRRFRGERLLNRSHFHPHRWAAGPMITRDDKGEGGDSGREDAEPRSFSFSRMGLRPMDNPVAMTSLLRIFEMTLHGKGAMKNTLQQPLSMESLSSLWHPERL
jgi:hypothetical protein